MALFCSPYKSPIFSFQSLKNFTIPKPFVSKTLKSPISIYKNSKISISIPLNFVNPALQRLHCCTSSSSSSSIKFDNSPPTIVFIKGQPPSTSGESLKTAFSQFGEVSRVKVITDKKTRKSLGFAYIWFASEDSAQMAVEEMNGKFFDGRFVFVTLSRTGSCKSLVKTAPYQF